MRNKPHAKFSPYKSPPPPPPCICIAGRREDAKRVLLRAYSEKEVKKVLVQMDEMALTGVALPYRQPQTFL